jgi:proteasome lid subunit RPN8/RPN11
MPGVLGRHPPERLRLPAALAEAIVGHALASREVEVCGLLGGADDRARSHYPVANVATSPRDSFLMDPIGQLAAFRAMQSRGEALVGIYHSHPAGPPAPSARDLEWAAYPDVAYLIVSLAGEGAPALAGFVFDGRAFQPLSVDRAA